MGGGGETHPKYLNKQKKKKLKEKIKGKFANYEIPIPLGGGCIPITVNFLIFTSISYTPPLPKKGNSMIIHSICKYKKNVCCDQKGGVGLGAGPLMLRAWIPMIFFSTSVLFYG